MMANAGFDIDPALAKSLAPKTADVAPATSTLAAIEPKADPIAKLAESASAAPAAAPAATASTTRAVGSTTTATSAPAPVTVGAPIPPAPLPIRQWQVLPKDLTIQATLRRWAREASWQVSWDVPIDYPATLMGTFTGSFEEATEKVLGAYKNSEFPLQGCFFEANSVLRVTRYVENSRDCE
ncbi:hypothetical protein LMG32289_05576 [Cupriavidus pampae]|jgi:hypothetical protein|uniref:Toxin co-regulated pilus biosynthesis protein Q C-terminal domain-containing protein n=2 Tax=Cupriavidus pampae TaxID=659251 RepID=A0ABM8XVP2_9BURK|nr:hypothetical protein LMG32289_05576 [Cupriavidus pampae]